MAWPDFAVVWQAQELVLKRVEDATRAFSFLDREIWSGDVVDEEGVAGEDRPRIVATAAVDQGKGGVLRAVARRMKGANQELADLELEAVLDRLMLVIGLGVPVNVDLRSRGGRQAAMAGDVIGVVVGLKYVLDRYPGIASQREVLVDLEPRIDDRGVTRLLVADEIGGASKIVVGDLAEDHAATSAPSTSALSSRS